MKSNAARTTAVRSASTQFKASLPRSSPLNVLALIAFVLLATALCARSLLWELWSIFIIDLLAPPHLRHAASLMARHTSHLVAAGGIALSALWMICARKRWRLTGLQIGAIVLVFASLLAVPAASAKRLALNTALDVILPLLAAASLYQLLIHHPNYRRALLAGLVAVAAASCWPDTAVRLHQHSQAQQARPQKAQAGNVAAPQPKGFFQHPNAFASFLELGVAGTVAALAGVRYRRRKAVPSDTGRNPAPSRAVPRPLTLLAIAILAGLAIWQLLVMNWIGSLATLIGLTVAVPTAVACIWLRSRPRTLAIVLGGGLVLLQVTLVVLALRAPTLFPAMAAHGGKIKSLAYRLDYWQGAIKLFTANPLTGIGPRQFGSSYETVKSAIVEDTIDPHNWLLNMAAEWGVLGVAGMLVALAGAGWMILRSLSPPPDRDDPPPTAALFPAGLLLLGCWLLVISDLPVSLWWVRLPGPVTVSLIAAAAVSLVSLHNRFSLAILLGGLMSFLVHTTVETSSTVPSAMWPFWAAIAMAMAWNAQPSAPSPQTALARHFSAAGLTLQILMVLAAIGLTIRPMSAAHMMHQAQAASLAGQNEQALKLLRTAATTDPYDTTPLEVAAMIEQQIAGPPSADNVPHLRRAVEALDIAVQRDLLRPILWYKLAVAEMTLGCTVDDRRLVDRAVSHMQRCLELWPTWSQGWFELAQMAAAVSSDGSERPAMLRLSLAALDKAQSLDDAFPQGDPARLIPPVRRGLEPLRLQVQQRLEAAVATKPKAATN